MVKNIIVDIESDGPCPGLYSMVSFGAVLFEDPSKVFYTTLMPITDNWVPEALAVSGFSREESEGFEYPAIAMENFEQWLKSVADGDGVRFVSDNAGFDWQFINYYFHLFRKRNPFGFSPVSITWLYKGFARTSKANFKSLRKTKHTHNPLDDAMGNAEALKAIVEKGFKL